MKREEDRDMRSLIFGESTNKGVAAERKRAKCKQEVKDRGKEDQKTEN